MQFVVVVSKMKKIITFSIKLFIRRANKEQITTQKHYRIYDNTTSSMNIYTIGTIPVKRLEWTKRKRNKGTNQYPLKVLKG